MYQVVITGRLLKGAERARVEAELTRLFKATPQQVAWLLRGKAIVVKSCEELALAQRYESALIRAGLECELRSDQPGTLPSKAAVPAKPVKEAPTPQQIPMPGVAPPPPPPPKPAPKPAASPTAKPVAPGRAAPARRPPTLGPVTEAITAQDRAPEFVARPTPFVVVPAQVATPRGNEALRVGLIMVGAALAGALGYFVMEKLAPRGGTPVSSATDAGMQGALQEPGTTPTAEKPAEKAVPLPPEKLLLGRWECFENNSGRAVQNEFLPDGRYRSLTYGRADAFMQVEQLDVLVEGKYRLDGKRVTLHVQRVPSREQFGQSERVDDYLYWDIQTLTGNVLAWNERRLQQNGETCLRSVSLSVPVSRG